jgi:hypothetical protein
MAVLPFFGTGSKKVTIYEWSKNWYDLGKTIKMWPFNRLKRREKE